MIFKICSLPIEGTQKAVYDSREEVGALRDYQVVSDVVRDEQVAASLDRRRFERILRRCAFVTEHDDTKDFQSVPEG